MPHGLDVEHDTSDVESEFECIRRGRIVTADTRPGTCDACGGEFQNRAKSLD
jgi:hypothetical protein